MAKVEGLRSPYDQTRGLVHFGRMLDKIRLHAARKLPADYVPYLGEADQTAFDGRICRFLGISYDRIVEKTLEGGADEAVLDWAFSQGHRPTTEEIEILSAFLAKRGWRDSGSPGLRQWEAEAGLPRNTTATYFDLKDIDEGRPIRFPADPPPFSGTVKGSVHLPGLRSPYDTVGGLVHFGRMLDKIRLRRAGLLPDAWLSAMGMEKGFDGLCCHFLRIDYRKLQSLPDDTDEALIAWAFAHGRRPTEEEIMIWNAYMAKRGWRDAYTNRLHFRLQEAGMPANSAFTMFDFIDLDESRLLRAFESEAGE